MDRLIYTAMTGAKQALEKQATTAHNLDALLAEAQKRALELGLKVRSLQAAVGLPAAEIVRLAAEVGAVALFGAVLDPVAAARSERAVAPALPVAPGVLGGAVGDAERRGRGRVAVGDLEVGQGGHRRRRVEVGQHLDDLVPHPPARGVGLELVAEARAVVGERAAVVACHARSLRSRVW